ncbi:hypothetical protein RU639_009771 [Aspergillus parasiticus]
MAEAVSAFNSLAQPKKATGANYNTGLKNTENGIGTLICHFDDTSPSKESEEFRESILHDLSLLGIMPDRITYSSDYVQDMYEVCIGLIKSGKATWKIYPTYDFCAPFLDSIEQVTHALRTNEYRDRNPQYHWMQEALGLRKVKIWDFSRLNFVRTVLSKRKLTAIVDKGVVWGWDDPRMPTAINKKYIDPVAARYTAIPSFNAVTALIDGVEATTSAEMLKHKNPSLGTKKVIFAKEIIISQDDAQHFKENERVTLMNWGNAIVSRITSDPATGKVLTLNLKLDLESDVKLTEKKITWLAKDSSNMVSIKLYTFDYLISKDKIEKHEDFASFLTKPSEFCTEAWADYNVAQLSQDDIIQFDRRVDQAYRDGQPAVMFNIPTGKEASSNT